jgi:hypothetical protein
MSLKSFSRPVALVAQEGGSIDEIDLELAEGPPNPIAPGLLECQARQLGEDVDTTGGTPIW